MSLSHNLEKFFFQERFCGEREEMDGRDGTGEITQDTTRLSEIEELKCAIRSLLFVTKLSRVNSDKDKAVGWGATLKCSSCLGCCEKKQESPVQLSRDRKSEFGCLQDLLKRPQDRHVDCPESLTKKAVVDAVADDDVVS
jgi:hypothetical protein